MREGRGKRGTRKEGERSSARAFLPLAAFHRALQEKEESTYLPYGSLGFELPTCCREKGERERRRGKEGKKGREELVGGGRKKRSQLQALRREAKTRNHLCSRFPNDFLGSEFKRFED